MHATARQQAELVLCCRSRLRLLSSSPRDEPSAWSFTSRCLSAHARRLSLSNFIQVTESNAGVSCFPFVVAQGRDSSRQMTASFMGSKTQKIPWFELLRLRLATRRLRFGGHTRGGVLLHKTIISRNPRAEYQSLRWSLGGLRDDGRSPVIVGGRGTQPTSTGPAWSPAARSTFREMMMANLRFIVARNLVNVKRPKNITG